MKKLNSLSIGIHNLCKQSVRTFIMICFTFIIAASLLITTILSSSMKKCVEQTVNQMGADIIIVPAEYASEYSDAIFSGTLCSFYFEDTWLQTIADTPGIKQATPELLLASLAADCCSEAVQLIAFEPKTDFIVTPWLREMNIDTLNSDEIILGSSFSLVNSGDTFYFFNVPFKVAGKLKETGTEYDHCAFINFDAAHELLKTDQLKDSTTLDSSSDSLISSIMLRLDDPGSSEEFADTLNEALRDSHLKALTPLQVISNVTQSVNSFGTFSNILTSLIFFIAVLAIVCIFSITILQRKHEFGIMITLGATKGNLVKMILSEGMLIGLSGGVLGVLSSGGVLLAFKDVLLKKLAIPTLITDTNFYVFTSLKCVGIATLAGILASLVAIFLICRREPLKLIQEGNA